MNQEKRIEEQLIHAESVSVDDNFQSMEAYVESEKKKFQELHGCENSFKVVTEFENEILEVNGFKGIMRVTVLDDNKQIVKVTEFNHFEGLDDMLSDNTKDVETNVEARDTVVLPKYSTKSPDPFSIAVWSGNYGSGRKYKITLSNWYFTKTYHKADYWNTGDTNGFYGCLQRVNVAVTTMINTVGFTLINKLLGKIGSILMNDKFPSTDQVVSIILDIASALGITIASPVTLAASAILYATEINRAQYFWNKIF